MEELKRRAFEDFEIHFGTVLKFKRDKEEKDLVEFVTVELLGKVDLLRAMKLISFDEFNYLHQAISFACYFLEVD